MTAGMRNRSRGCYLNIVQQIVMFKCCVSSLHIFFFCSWARRSCQKNMHALAFSISLTDRTVAQPWVAEKGHNILL